MEKLNKWSYQCPSPLLLLSLHSQTSGLGLLETEIGAAQCAIGWRGKEFYFFWQRSMRNAWEAKERLPKLKQSFSSVLLKENCSLSTGDTG